jgi:hypothetical protein
MTTDTPDDRLYALLPAVHRMRDAAQGYVLRDLLRVIGRQVAVVEEDVARLYDDWFIETAADWVVPYLGDLIGWAPVREAGAAAAMPGASALAPAYSPRREVANTVAHRRRKGTFGLLAQLAWDVAGWRSVAVEFYRRLAWMQHLDHRHPDRGRTADVRDPGALARIDGPFDGTPRTVDVRRIVSRSSAGRYNIPSVGLFVCRLQSLGVTRTPARQLEEVANHCYSFSILGNDAPLFVRPAADGVLAPGDPPELALPVAIDRALLTASARGRRPRRASAAPAVYGEQASVAVFAPNWPTRDAPQPIPTTRVIPADLGGWAYRPPRGYVAIDPVRGRIVFPPNHRPEHVTVSYRYGFPARLGGGEYARHPEDPPDAKRYSVHADGHEGDLPAGHFATIQDALDRWGQDAAADSAARVAVIELAESGTYRGPVRIELAAGLMLYLRAAERTRPVVRLVDNRADQSDALLIAGRAGSRVVLDGLLVVGRGVVVRALHEEEGPVAPDLCDVTLRHCTLVPGWTLHCDCEPRRPSEPSVVLDGTTATLRIAYSIVGAIQVVADEVRTDPVAIAISDSIVDATGPERLAIGSASGGVAFAALTLARVTVVGEVRTHAIDLAENAIFTSEVFVARRQRGCVRYSYVPYGSRTPRRHRCQPDAALATIDPALTGPARDAEVERVVGCVQPQFDSLRYGRPDYCRLVAACGEQIRRGADDESEMGAYHGLYEPQREASLRVRLDEHTPVGMQGGIIFVN